MRGLIDDIRRWRAAGSPPVALATIVQARGSSLRPAGTRMALNGAGEFSGSVSSGCVDGDVIDEMTRLAKCEVTTAVQPQYGISDELAWSVGLACGGTLDIAVERWTAAHDLVLDEVAARRPVGIASRLDVPMHLVRLDNGQTSGTLGDPGLDASVLEQMSAAWPGPYQRYLQEPNRRVFLEVIPPPPALVIFGATDIAIPLAKMAKLLDFEVVVSDARRAFLTEERFPDTDIRFGWPQHVFKALDFGPGWAIVVLFHDAKLDVPALTIALQSQAFYIGFLGSRTTQADRRKALQETGFRAEDLARIRGPVGLDIGGRDPAMIALSILAEIVAVRHRRAGGLMSDPTRQDEGK